MKFQAARQIPWRESQTRHVNCRVSLQFFDIHIDHANRWLSEHGIPHVVVLWFR